MPTLALSPSDARSPKRAESKIDEQGPSIMDNNDEPLNRHRFAISWISPSVFAGTVAGVTSSLIGFPLDTIKSRLQSQTYRGTRIYSGVTDCIAKSWRSHGARGFFDGMSVPLIMTGFQRAMFFYAWAHSADVFVEKWRKYEAGVTSSEQTFPKGRYTVKEAIAGGFVAGMAVSVVQGPVELVKTQLQLYDLRSREVGSSYSSSARSEVWRQFSRLYCSGQMVRVVSCGLPITFARNAFSCVYMGTYHGLLNLIEPEAETPSACSAKTLIVSGALAGAAFWIAVSPFDVMKTVIQGRRLDGGRDPSLLSTARALYADGGVSRFYRGLLPSVLRTLPVSAAMILSYEKVYGYLTS